MNISEFQLLTKISCQKINHLVNGKVRVVSKIWTIFDNSLNAFRSEIKLPPSKLSELKLCEHCNKQFNPINYTRWHGSNCKQLKPSIHA